MTQALTVSALEGLLPADAPTQKAIAIGLSGGPDSMALAWLLAHWAKQHKVKLHALIVDHGLRPESKKEAALTAKRVKNWPNVTAKILTLRLSPENRLMETARAARYEAFAKYCKTQKIRHLYLAHHQDDQAETVLLRLAAGSGLDGLAGMRPMQAYDKSLSLIRPLLGVSKAALIATCGAHKIEYVQDPSNEKDTFARPRLRKAAQALEREGLTPKRLATTARRVNRAKIALESLSDKAFDDFLLEKDTHRIVLSTALLIECLDEIAFRAILKAIRALRPQEDYLPRMEKIEDIFEALKSATPFRKRTLGGLVFERRDKDCVIVIAREK